MDSKKSGWDVRQIVRGPVVTAKPGTTCHRNGVSNHSPIGLSQWMFSSLAQERVGLVMMMKYGGRGKKNGTQGNQLWLFPFF